MPAYSIIRQQYQDPISGKTEIAEMELDIEMIQKDDIDSISSFPALKVIPPAHLHIGHAWRKEFKPVYVDPSELISCALDAKRTTNTKGCKRTRLQERTGPGSKQIVVIDPELISVNIGDALVVLSDLKGSQKHYCIVEKISSNFIEVAPPMTKVFYKGSIVENLSDRWHRDVNFLGAKSQLKRPQPMPIQIKATKNNDGIHIIMQSPISLGILKACDIYVRKEYFETLERHWMADKSDIDIQEDSVVINTYGGGEDAGGGVVEKGNKYYVGLVTKDGFGSNNVNESEVVVKEILI